MVQFFLPYIMFCYSAGYALLQTLDGLGIVPTNFLEISTQGYLINSYWSPDEFATNFGALFLEFIIVLLPFIFLSSWILARKKGVIICFLLLITPGLLSFFHLLPYIQWLPLTYNFRGTGATGNASGIGTLIFIGLGCGWVFTVLIVDIFSTGEKFRQWIDVLLILTALTNGVFWVSDREASEGKKAYEETITDINDSAKYLLSQVKDYSRMCNDNNISMSVSCQWASSIQEKLENIASTKSSVIKYEIPNNLSDFYQIPVYGKVVNSEEEIRQEFDDYNKKVCPYKIISKKMGIIPPPSQWCQTPPTAYCNAIQTGKFKTEMGGRFAVANECVLTSIMRYRDVLLKEENRLSLSKNNPHYRWMWYIIMSFFIGGKIANIMTKICDIDNRHESEKRKIKLISLKLFGCFRKAFFQFLILSEVCFSFVYSIMKKILRNKM